MITNRILWPLYTFVFLLVVPSKLEAQEEPSINGSQKVRRLDSTILNTKWKNALNARDSSAMDFYTSDAIKINSEDQILTGPEAIYKQYASQEAIKYIGTAYAVDANIARGISYEINVYKPNNSPIFVQLVIYEKVGDQKLRAFEYDADQPMEVLKSVSEKITGQLRERREQWMDYCNTHDVPGLIYDLYSHNTLYFNHRPLVQGRESLVREYAYMNNAQYKLKLIPNFLSVVNDTTVFEIGQCEGSYNGKYILIWKKEEDGVWRIFVDSNV